MGLEEGRKDGALLLGFELDGTELGLLLLGTELGRVELGFVEEGI